MDDRVKWNVANQDALEQAARLILAVVPKTENPKYGYNPDHMDETPERFTRGMGELLRGYFADAERLKKTFPGTSRGMVVVRDMEFYSLCPHHLIPYHGKADIAYIPDETGTVVGLSKMPRLVDMFTRRFITQEEATDLIADFMDKEMGLNPAGVGVRLRARHFCMCSRGINKQESWAMSLALRGNFTDLVVRDEWNHALKAEL